MRTAPTRADRRARTREELVEAADRLFTKNGFHATSVDAVADDAGYTKGAVYSNFESKEDLFFAVCERRVDRRVEEIEATLASGETAYEGLELLIVGLEQRHDDGWLAVFFEFWAHVLRHPELRERFAEQHRRGMLPVVGALERIAAERGERLPEDPMKLAIARSRRRPASSSSASLSPTSSTRGSRCACSDSRWTEEDTMGYRSKRLQDFTRGVRASKELAERERWPRERLERFQQARLEALAGYAAERSPFWRKRIPRGRLDLAELPVLTKHELMEHFDELVTDPRLRLAELLDHLSKVDRDALYLGEHRVMATSGSSGRKAVFVYDRPSWMGVLTMFLRRSAWIGMSPGLPRKRVASSAAPPRPT